MQPRPQGPYASGPMNAPVMLIVLLILFERWVFVLVYQSTNA